MAETSETCSRCGGPLGPDRSEVAITSGRLTATHPALTICPRCTDSMERWLARGGAGRSRQERPSRPPGPKPTPPLWNRAFHVEREARIRRLVVIGVLLGLGFVVGLLLLLI
jgi:hypothetical protein